MLLIPTNRPLVPRYGNYGGPGHSGEDENGIPYSLRPKDALDTLFMQHDKGYDAAKESGKQIGYVMADFLLLKKIKELDPDLLDAEGKIYRAAAIEAFEGKIWIHGAIAVQEVLIDAITKVVSAKSYRPVVDPFALDLDGDGIETTNVSSGILFDHNADDVKTGTGWVKGDDALLVRDLNGNGTIDSGRELFGDQTLLTNGQLAANGFAALRDLDANADGMIDASDAAFAQLKIWRDLNQDGISQTEELQTLAEAGIASINLTATTKNQGQNGNTIASTGTYTKADGSTGTTGDVNLAINTATTEFIDDIEVPETLLDLPDMSGSGQVRNLQQAAALSPTLADLLTQYSGAITRDSQIALLDQMLLAWADTSGMAKSLDNRDPAHYKVEYLSMGNISRSQHLQQNTTSGTVPASLQNADNPLINDTYRTLISNWNSKIHILEAFNGSYFFQIPGQSQEGGGAATGIWTAGGDGRIYENLREGFADGYYEKQERGM